MEGGDDALQDLIAEKAILERAFCELELRLKDVTSTVQQTRTSAFTARARRQWARRASWSLAILVVSVAVAFVFWRGPAQAGLAVWALLITTAAVMGPEIGQWVMPQGGYVGTVLSIQAETDDSVVLRMRLSRCMNVVAGHSVSLLVPNFAGHVEGHWNGAEDAEVGLPRVARPYSPLGTGWSEEISLLVRCFLPAIAGIRKYPDGGKASRYIRSLAVGDLVDLTEPSGHFCYSPGVVRYRQKVRAVRSLGLISGGVRIASAVQVVRAVLDNPSDDTTVHLLVTAERADDIPLKGALDALSLQHSDRFHVAYTVSQVQLSDNWTGFVGLVNAAMLIQSMPTPGAETAVLLTGPSDSLRDACVPYLLEIGFTRPQLLEI
mmetsp:Transcript_133459/g.302745  ORF Transcript_133459/g.302745 Transcript_133459/m.302745 type:complete len:378 (-) Transcript_133459:193-1326(-)